MKTREHMSKMIRELRQRANLNQSELGKMLSNPKKGGTISSWETGRTAPDENDLLDMCEIFGVDISYFYPSTNDGDDITPEERELLMYFRALSDKARHALIIGLYDYISGK